MLKLNGQTNLRCCNALKVSTDVGQRDVLNQVIGCWGARIPCRRKILLAAMQICRDLNVEMPSYGW